MANFKLEVVDVIAKQLYDVYMSGFAFPKWNLTSENLLLLDVLSKETVVYYGKSDEIRDVVSQTLVREPCNIGMGRMYSRDKMKKLFGWSTGFYGKHYNKTGVLAPNIGIYCYTPMEQLPI